MQETILTGPRGDRHSSPPHAGRCWPRSAPDGEPALVPICFVLAEAADDLGRAILYSPLDEKPKVSVDPRDLARVRDMGAARRRRSSSTW